MQSWDCIYGGDPFTSDSLRNRTPSTAPLVPALWDWTEMSVSTRSRRWGLSHRCWGLKRHGKNFVKECRCLFHKHSQNVFYEPLNLHKELPNLTTNGVDPFASKTSLHSWNEGHWLDWYKFTAKKYKVCIRPSCEVPEKADGPACHTGLRWMTFISPEPRW